MSGATDGREPGLLRGSASSWLVLFAAAIMTLVTTPALVHSLGSGGFSLWASLSSAVAYAALVDFGFGGTVWKFLGQFQVDDQGALPRFLGTMVAAYFVAFVVAVIVAIGLSFLLPVLIRIPPASAPSILPTMVFLGIAVGLLIWNTALANVLHSYQRLVTANLIRSGYWLSMAATYVVISITGHEITTFAIATAALSGGACVASAAAIRLSLPHLRVGRPSISEARRIVSYSWFIFMINSGATVAFQSDNLVIAAILGLGSVAPYAAALRLTRSMSLALHKVADVMFPFYSALATQGRTTRIAELYLLTARAEVAGALAALLLLGFAGPALLRLWVGPALVAPILVIGLASILVVIEAIIHPAAVVAASIGGERPMAGWNNLEGAVNVAASILLTWRFGLAGTIAGTVIAQSLTNLWWLPRWTARRLDIRARTIWREVASPALGPFAAGLAAAVLCEAALGSSVRASLAAAVCGLSVYGAGYVMFGMTPSERSWIVRQVAVWRW